MIKDVEVKNLRVIHDDRGYLMEILRSDEQMFEKFGQVYITTVYPGVVKGWHYHKMQTDHIAVISGMAKLVLFDDRENSTTRGDIDEFIIGDKNPMLVKIPPGVLHGFRAVGPNVAMMLNCPTELYNYDQPDEHRIVPHGEIPYDWSIRDG